MAWIKLFCYAWLLLAKIYIWSTLLLEFTCTTCSSLQVIPDLYEVMFCPRGCIQPAWMPWVIDLSHLLVCVNSSANFLIYMLGGEKFR